MDASLVLGALADLAVAGVFAAVGLRLSRRSVAPPAKAAARGFHLWWMGIALLWALDGARGLAVAAGAAPGSAWWTAFLYAHYAFVAVLCVALAGLLTYLLFLFTGRAWQVPLALFYGAYLAVAAWTVAVASPADIRVGAWATHVTYARDLAPWAEATLFLFLLAPQLAGAGAYLTLARRTRDPERRYRILVVGWTLLAWIGVNLLADLASWTYADGWQLARRALGLAASTSILLAYEPPARVRRWLARQEEGPA